MREDWKVYIKGVQGRGEEVKQALINLGGYVVRDYNYTVSDCLYYINHNEEIRRTKKTTEIGKIIMDNYKEIKLSGQWSDGDILVRKDNNNLFCVYQKPVDNGKGFLCHVYVTKDVLFTGVTVPTDPADNYRKATDAEESTFYSLINNHHLNQDTEKKQLVDWESKDKEELPEWEDGDILIRKDRIKYIVFRKYSYNTMFYDYDFTISKDAENKIWYSISGEEKLYKTENFRLATSKEIKQFYDLLHKMDRDWDSEKKYLVKLKRKPTLGIFIE